MRQNIEQGKHTPFRGGVSPVSLSHSRPLWPVSVSSSVSFVFVSLKKHFLFGVQVGVRRRDGGGFGGYEKRAATAPDLAQSKARRVGGD